MFLSSRVFPRDILKGKERAGERWEVGGRMKGEGGDVDPLSIPPVEGSGA